MKKILLLAAGLLITSSSFVKAGDKPFVSIDSIAIMQKSVEGQELTKKIQKEIEQFQEDFKNAQKDLSDMNESLSKQSKVLSKEAMQEKAEELNRKRKQLENDFALKEESLRASIQKKQVTLRERQLAVIAKVSEKEAWGAVIDKNTPGLLFVAADSNIDKTDEVLRAVDVDYKAKNTAKTTTTVKTAANGTTNATPTPSTIKVA